MFGCESEATALASRSKRARASGFAAVLREDLDGDVAVELRVARAVDLAHAARAERREDLVGTETGSGDESHFAPATSFSNRGFLRSGSKLGSIFSQPGERKSGIFSSGSSWSSAFSGSPTRM